MKYFIFDGNHLVFRSISVSDHVKNFKNKFGVFTGGVHVTLNMLWNLYGNGQFVMVFDHSRPQFRKDLLPSYKEKDRSKETEEKRKEREEAYERFKVSKEQLFDLLPSMGVPTFHVEGQEGDDVCYFVGKHLITQGHDVTIVSDDSDYYLMLNLGMKVYRSMKKEYVTADIFKKKFNFDVGHYALYLAMTGTHNAVPGIKGVGPKTAEKIIIESQALTSSELKEYCEGQKSKKIKSVAENIDVVERNLKLIDFEQNPVDRDVIISEYNKSIEKAKIDYNKVESMFSDFEFRSHDHWLTELKRKSNV